MKAVLYLWGRSIKNYMRQAIKKPGPSIVYLILIAFVIFAVFQGSNEDISGVERNVTGYAAILVGIFLFIACITIFNGLKQGTALFSMADVNILFTAPVPPGKILISGIAKQAGIMIFASIAMLAQYPNMRNAAGLDGMALLGLMVAYAMFGIAMNVLSASLYAFCAGAEGRRRRVYNILVGLIVIVVGLSVYFAMQEGNMLAALLRVFGSNAWNYVPIIGWGRGLAIAFAEYDYLLVFVFFLLMVLGIFICIRILRKADMDFFEDVLQAAERANQVQEDAKVGRMPVQGSMRRHAKRDLGEMRGKSAAAFMYKIMREQKRTGFWLFDAATLTTVAGPLFCLIFFSGEMMQEGILWALFGMTAWIMLFMNLRSGVSRELTYPFLYLTPAGAWSKLIYVLMPQIIKAIVDGVVYAIFVMVLLPVTMTEGAIAFIFYISISMLYAAGMLLVERILGSSRNKVLTMMLYIFMLLLLFAPGLALGIILGGTFAIPHFAYLLSVAWNIGVSLLVVLLCKNMLNSMEL